ncbi:hypothetical protein CASFOL_042289 [Castilleja foliolosa]|uniref:Uncharacterized protein n=1 Tax=Castilleja foliolosa TaxID=1961234 RepID=A0ABD3BBI8_9LAMI
MVNIFDENDPLVQRKYHAEPYFRDVWTKEMEKSILTTIIGMKEKCERNGAKKAGLSACSYLFKDVLKSTYGSTLSRHAIKQYVIDMNCRYLTWSDILEREGVYQDKETGLVSIDTTITQIGTEMVFDERYHLYDMPANWELMDLAWRN